MTRELLRFPVSATDQSQITAGSISFQDGGSAYPNFLRTQFTIPAASASPKVMPLFAGAMKFLADAPTPPQILPKPSDITEPWTQAQYDTWQTVGTLQVTLDPAKVTAINVLSGIPLPIPHTVWYWKVQLTKDFLFNSIRGPNGLKAVGVTKLDGTMVKITDPSWPAYAVSGFLNGTYEAVVRMHLTDPTKDDAVLLEMPRFDMTAAGDVVFWVALAASKRVDDGDSASINALAGSTSLLDPNHPANGLIHARRTLTGLTAHLIDGQPGGGFALSDALSAAWPAGPRYFQIRASFPGRATALYNCGALVNEQITVTDSAGTTLIQQPMCLDGIVTVEQPPPAAGNPAPDPPTVTAQFSPGTLKITDSNGDRTGLPANQVKFDFNALSEDARLTLQPPGPAAPTYNDKLARMCWVMGKVPSTKDEVKRLLGEWATTIRPSTWASTDEIFHGTRYPWAGAFFPDKNDPVVPEAVPGDYAVELGDLQALFDALQNLTPAPTPIRAGDAMLLWIMEGRIKSLYRRVGLAKRESPWHDVVTFAAWTAAGTAPNAPTDATIQAASGADVKRFVRTILLYTFYGLDIMMKIVFSAAVGDSVVVWTGNFATDLGVHDAAMASELTTITNLAIPTPMQSAITDAVEVSKSSETGRWQFRTLDVYLDRVLWLQYAEFLGRILGPGFPVMEKGGPDPRDYPSFCYIAWNGGITAAAGFWNQALDVLAGNPPPWVKTPEDALRSWQLTGSVFPPTGEQGRTSQGPNDSIKKPDRSHDARVNGLHFGALAHSYGAIFPRVLVP